MELILAHNKLVIISLDYYYFFVYIPCLYWPSDAGLISAPLSLTMIEPVMLRASLDARNEAKLAMSSDVPMRFMSEHSTFSS